MPPNEGHSFLSGRPGASFKLLWTAVDHTGRTTYRWNGEARLHSTPADAYDAAGLDPSQAPPPASRVGFASCLSLKSLSTDPS